MRQDTRFLRMNTPLGQDRLVVTELSGEESLSTLFTFRVSAFSLDQPIDLAQLVGRPAVVTVRSGHSDDRHFHGYVATASHRGLDFAAKRHGYELVLVPWLWFLSKRADCRIFQNKSVVQIAEEIFQELGFTDFKLQLIGAYATRVYCVQYRETDLNFLSRLFEEEGIVYFFTHANDRHVLVLADSSEVHAPFAGTGKIDVKRADAPDRVPGIEAMTERLHVKAGRAALSDFNFETPKTDLAVTATTIQGQPFNSDLELFDFPGGHPDRGDGDRRARLRIAAEESTYRQYEGRSNVPALACGTSMEVGRHEITKLNGRYTLVTVIHRASNDLEGGGAGYSNSFVAIPHDTPYRPPARALRPVVEGPQTAIVVGPKGEEIFTDKYGRIKVSFHWDRRSKADETSSCWVRVAQPSAGVRWGGVFLPRVGMEVVVEFLEGDPDRPLVTGCVYNADTMPPYPLPDHKTRSLVKTKSSPKAAGFNELRFEDKAGSEHIFLHAQKDWDIQVLNDRRGTIGGLDDLTVGKDRRTDIKGADGLTVAKDRRADVRGSDSLTVAKDIMVKAGANASLDAGVDIDQKAGMNFAVKAGMQLVLEAGAMLSLKVGGSFITLTPGSVAISGPMILINSGGAASGLSAAPDKPDKPAKPKLPQTAQGGADTVAPPRTLVRPTGTRERIAQAEAMRSAAASATPFCQICQSQGTQS